MIGSTDASHTVTWRRNTAMTDATANPANIVGVPGGAMLQNLMGEINGNPGPRQVPGRTIPVPTSVSAELQTAIAMPYWGYPRSVDILTGWALPRQERMPSWVRRGRVTPRSSVRRLRVW